MKIETRCVHSGEIEDTITGGVNSPVFPSSACGYLDREDPPYPRYFNTLNQEGVVKKICSLEGAEDGVVFSSGMAAISTVLMTFLGKGDHAILQDEIYGGTHAFITEHFHRLGISCSFTATDVSALENALTPRTRLIYIESPTNPLLSIMDIQKTAALGRRSNCLTVIDNTFGTPINQNPVELGIDIVVHSGTKYLGGHSDLCCGVAVTRKELARRIRKTATGFGGSINPLTCHLLERSLKTLSIRVERQNENAARLARFLSDHPEIGRVFYPGLTDHPGHQTAREQMKGFGAMLSFELKGEKRTARAFMERLRLIKPAVSLGGVETTICDPATTSHAKVSPEVRKRQGISDGLLRLSVGIENAEDLMEDMAKALE